jgi:hypothetical protein
MVFAGSVGLPLHGNSGILASHAGNSGKIDIDEHPESYAPILSSYATVQHETPVTLKLPPTARQETLWLLWEICFHPTRKCMRTKEVYAPMLCLSVLSRRLMFRQLILKW